MFAVTGGRTTEDRAQRRRRSHARADLARDQDISWWIRIARHAGYAGSQGDVTATREEVVVQFEFGLFALFVSLIRPETIRCFFL